MSALDATREITTYVKGWNQQVFRFFDQFFNNPNARANRDALAMHEDAKEAKAEVQNGTVSAGYLSSCVVIMHTSKETLDDYARELRRVIQSIGFGCRKESINAVEAWLGSLPGNSYANQRRPLIPPEASTKTLAWTVADTPFRVRILALSTAPPHGLHCSSTTLALM